LNTIYSILDKSICIRTGIVAGCALVASIFSGCNAAYAVEGGTFGGPIGGTDIRQAFLPPTTGLYGGLVGVGITAPSLQGVDGNASKAAAPSYIASFIGGGGLLYVYPINPLGFTIASSFQLAWQTTAQELNTRAGLKSGIVNGLTDSFADIFLASHYIGLMGADPGPHPIPRLRYGLTSGLAGLFAQQLNDDVSRTGAQVAPDGNRFEKLGVGPVMAYDSEALHSTIKFKALFPIHNENAYLTTQYVLSASFKLY
jgi:hypothetical protein